MYRVVLLALCCLEAVLCMSHGMYGGGRMGYRGGSMDYDYDVQEVLNNDPDFILKCKCDVAHNTLHFKVSGKTNGYVAIGISKTSGMPMSDIAMGGIHNGNRCIKDMWAETNAEPKDSPPEEMSQDLRDASVKFMNGWTHFKFCRDRKNFMENMGASMGDVAIEEDENVYVNWAIGEFDPNENCDIKQHTHRGSMRMVLCPKQNLPNSENLAQGVDMRWSKMRDYLTVEISATTDGWVGFGFSPDGKMKNSDMFMGYVRHGMVYLQDRHTGPDPYTTGPDLDAVGNWKIVEGSNVGGKTTIRATRSLMGDGSSQDKKIKSRMYVIWSKGNRNGLALTPHGDTPNDRGSKLVQLYPMPTLDDIIANLKKKYKH